MSTDSNWQLRECERIIRDESIFWLELREFAMGR
jgi:hypothetical protein